MCLTIAAFRQQLPVISVQLCLFVLLWGLLGTVGGGVLLFYVVQQLPASTVSIILVCEGFIVYGCVAARGNTDLSQLEITIVCIAANSALGTVLMAHHVTGMGAVYGSQAGYTITFAGIVWSILLLDERLNAGTHIALSLLVIGLTLVEPAKSETEVAHSQHS